MTEELKLCPFCGGVAKIRRQYVEDYFPNGAMFYWVQCKKSNCDARTDSKKSKTAAVARWNRRAIDVTQEAAPELLEALEFTYFHAGFSPSIHFHKEQMDKALSAIKKAKGE
jgi:Lar family restriction alleviation protein